MPPRTWGKYVKSNYSNERLNHPDKATTIRALSAAWAALKSQRGAAKAAQRAPAVRRPTAPPPPSPPRPPPPSPPPVELPPDIAARGEDPSDALLITSRPNFAVTTAAELRPDAAVSPWRGGWNMLSGSSATVLLWVRLNEHNQIAERRVVKTAKVKRKYWLDATKWTGNVADYTARLPKDYVLHRRVCTAVDGGAYFARVRACVVDNDAWTYKLIYDYCDQEDVFEMVDRFRQPPPDTERVPEPLVWSILEDLVKALLVMEQGAVESPQEGWVEIIHRDMKPDNIFLSTKPQSIYPQVKVGDFEYSIETSAEDPFNPTVWREDEAGHEAYWAPEMRTTVDRGRIIALYPSLGLTLPQENFRADLSAEKISSRTNVWSVGTTLFILMCRVPKFRSFNGRKSRAKENDSFWERWPDDAVAAYSSELVELAKSCLRDDPATRPTPTELLASIRSTSDDERCQLMKRLRRGAPADGGAWGNEDFGYYGADDPYKLRMSYDTLLANKAAESDSDTG